MRSLVRIALLFPFLLGGASAVTGETSGSQHIYGSLIAQHAAANAIPADLAQAVVRHESNFNAGVTGKAGEVGLMQIKYQTARGMGYRGTRKALYDPATNIAWGMKYLGQARKLAGGSECGTLSRYNGGLATKRMIKSYCRGVAQKSAELRKAGGVKVASIYSAKVRVAAVEQPRKVQAAAKQVRKVQVAEAKQPRKVEVAVAKQPRKLQVAVAKQPRKVQVAAKQARKVHVAAVKPAQKTRVAAVRQARKPVAVAVARTQRKPVEVASAVSRPVAVASFSRGPRSQLMMAATYPQVQRKETAVARRDRLRVAAARARSQTPVEYLDTLLASLQ